MTDDPSPWLRRATLAGVEETLEVGARFHPRFGHKGMSRGS